jgi:hypothetical protein
LASLGKGKGVLSLSGIPRPGRTRARRPRRAGQLIPPPSHHARKAQGVAVRTGAERGKVRKKGWGEADKPVPQVSERYVKGRGHR